MRGPAYLLHCQKDVVLTFIFCTYSGLSIKRTLFTTMQMNQTKYKLIEEYLSNLELTIASESRTTKLLLPEALGKGWTYSIDLGGKMKILNRCICPNEDLYVRYDNHLPCNAPIGAFTLQGAYRSDLLSSKSNLRHEESTTFWGDKPEEYCASYFPAGIYTNMVHLFVKKDIFSYSPEQDELSEKGLMAYFTGGKKGIVSPSQKTSFSTTRLIHGLLNMTLDSHESWLRLESTLLSVLANSAEEYGATVLQKPSTTLSPQDISALDCARDILIAQMVTPPSIQELARQIGINEFKLKRGFKLYFGETVYGYLRDYRLSTAATLIAKKHMNITEAALHVGYSNPSAFTAAFKKKFGVSPAIYRKNK